MKHLHCQEKYLTTKNIYDTLYVSSKILYTRKGLIILRMLPFFKPKKGFQFAGSGFDAGSGGGGGGGGSFPPFSTDEVDTGMKWVDGKSIYMKSATYNSGSSQAQATVSNMLLTTDIPIFACGMYKHATLNRYRPIDFTSWEIDTGNVLINLSSYGTNVSGYITIFYTKGE